MSDRLQHELKKEFQLERLILFSDAVFAIAITLLVLEIRIPDLDRHTATDALLLRALDELMPKFIGFIISFFFIGLYWTVHHRMFGYVVNYDQKLLWLNLIFLMAVVLMPFSTGIYSTYIFRFLKVPIFIYAGNIIFLGIMNVLMWRCIGNPKRKLTENLPRAEIRYFTIRALMVPLMFLIMAIIYTNVNKVVALYVPMVIPLVMRIYRKFFFKKNELSNEKA